MQFVDPTLATRLIRYHRQSGLTWREIAEQLDCVVSLVMHVRKGRRNFGSHRRMLFESLERKCSWLDRAGSTEKIHVL